ncbi:MAG TPA: hypothetical protein PK760_04275, partial [Flavobacteriales bacterium]|nr:hypothetical protein [Flavobacteriales bacterium]
MAFRINWKEWGFCLALYSPVLVFYAAHFAAPVVIADAIPTGFVQYDQPYYMACARQYVDGATNGLFYSSPFSAAEHPPNIYFQPQIALLGWLWSVFGRDPGMLFVLFGCVFGLLCVRTCLRVLDHLLPDTGKWRALIAILFLWGGGIFFLLGSGFGLLHGAGLSEAWETAFRFDPEGGWWFLNLGRNLVYPLEAYYHFFFFSIVLAALRKKFVVVVMLSALLAISQPFTGVATLLMLIAWTGIEALIAGKERVRPWVPFALIGVLALTLMYYMLFLPSDPEHRSLMEQWRLPWKEEGITIVGAYALVGALVLVRIRKAAALRSVLASSTQRLLLVQALVWFALENHDVFIAPVQPLHFTRGYTWSALFLLGAPTLLSALKSMHARPRTLVLRASMVIGLAVMLCDNATWLLVRANDNLHARGESVCLARDQQQLFAWLTREVPSGSLLVAQDPMTAYLALVYTPHRAFYSHHSNTPLEGMDEMHFSDDKIPDFT